MPDARKTAVARAEKRLSIAVLPYGFASRRRLRRGIPPCGQTKIDFGIIAWIPFT